MYHVVGVSAEGPDYEACATFIADVVSRDDIFWKRWFVAT